MPTLKMKTKSVTSCVREGSGLHICRKSSKISKNSKSSHETAELSPNGSSEVKMLYREVGTNETAGHQPLTNAESVHRGCSCSEIEGSAERMECMLSTSTTDLETIFSPIMDSAIHYELNAQDDAEIKHTHHSGSYEELLENTDHSWFHQINTCDQEHDDNPGNNNLDEAECFNPYLFLRNLPDLSDGGNTFLSALLPEETTKRKHVTLVLDLDETLVHSTLQPCHNTDFSFQAVFNMKEHTVYVRQRPFLRTFLERVAEMFEIIIFTASQSIYAEQLLDKLNPDRKLFSRRAYRDSCIFSDGNYTRPDSFRD